MGYDIPVQTPFVGRNFNVTRAGIHADGLMKDEEIYNIFDTETLLNRPATVMLGQNSGLAGIAYWMNNNYGLHGDDALDKRDPVVVDVKAWIDREYADGRQTALSAGEIEAAIEQISGGKYRRL